ncbi:hypothetical protein D3C71_2122140 [compost metagenome]
MERADIIAGGRRSGVVEIREGLAAGQRIVVDGTGKLRPGLKIQAEEAAPVAPAAATTAEPDTAG